MVCAVKQDAPAYAPPPAFTMRTRAGGGPPPDVSAFTPGRGDQGQGGGGGPPPSGPGSPQRGGFGRYYSEGVKPVFLYRMIRGTAAANQRIMLMPEPLTIEFALSGADKIAPGFNGVTSRNGRQSTIQSTATPAICS